ncbi:hypothetical protein LSM04_008498 [Trypanosoma melophagium]|uniref:uncharacterized protein n=1 Tax=Trypanosoma melophagium TaxID=715481 RepID=UPI00351A4E05|nr:hypothetical protein LSM04_008498 [Trypanosoma melophagium]
MYLGPWEEYRILKAIENLREKKERMRLESTSTAGGGGITLATTMWGPDADRSSSHHFPLNLDTAPVQDTSLVESTRVSHTGSSPSTSSRVRKRKKNTQPPKTALRFLMKVRDVDVYAEEEVASTPTVKSNESVDALSCSDGASEGRRHNSNLNKTNSEFNLRGTVHNNTQVETVTGGSAVPMDVHVELGTGRVLRKPQLHPISNVSSEEVSRLQQSDMSYSRIQNNQSLLEFLRGAPLDTKSKYERAGQPLPERHTEKNVKKVNSTGEAELERQIERRLRLQMLYSGNYTSDDISKAEDIEPLERKEEEEEEKKKQDQKENGEDLTLLQPFSGVPWDVHFPNPPRPPSMSTGTPEFPSGVKPLSIEEKQEKSFLRVASALGRTRIFHPYDVGAPIAPPIQVPCTSLREVTTPLGTPSLMMYGRICSSNNSSSSGGRRGGSGNIALGRRESIPLSVSECAPPYDRSRGETLPPSPTEVSQNIGIDSVNPIDSDPLPLSDNSRAPGGNPLDDDTVGALISWAEQLDPENIF